MKMKNSVLQITPFFKPDMGGIQTHLDDLCEYLRNNGWYIYVYTYKPLNSRKKTLKLEKRKNLEVYRISWIKGNWAHRFERDPLMRFLYLTVMLLIYCGWFMIFNHKKIKVIHAHGINAGFVAVVLKIFFKKKIILSTHSVYDKDIGSSKKFVKKFINPILLSYFDKILAISDKSVEELIGQGIKEKKIQRYHHWIDQKIFKPYDKEEMRKELNFNFNKIVLFVGRMVSPKGIKLLIEVAKQLKEIDFVFIGSGSLSTWIKRQTYKISNIHYIGKVRNYDLPRYYSAADILCIPSLREEGYARVIAEAASCGTPVIGSDVVGNAEAINRKIGIKFKLSVKDIKYAIKIILDSQEKYSKSCLKYARENYSIANAEAILKTYL